VARRTTQLPLASDGGHASHGVVVAAVRPRSDAERGGLRPGDRVLAIDGTALRDAIDFQFHAGEARLALDVVRAGEQQTLELTRRGGDLGVELEAPRPAEIATCANKCVFCFIHQLPRGMRKSLYVKDDDFRLSFLHGNYITLTDLDEAELRRIETQRLSPLYISVHATDPDLRHRLLGEPAVRREVLPLMARLGRAGIRMHAQIVLVPEWNDGPHLERSVRELAALHPAVSTTAVVPVGLTRHRERLPRLRTLTADEARGTVAAIHGWQRALLPALGTRFVFAADELYLQSGVALPPAAAYEGYPLAEDGVGLVRRFEDAWPRAARRRPRRGGTSAVGAGPAAATVTATAVTGTLYGPRLARLCAGLTRLGLDVRVAEIRNDWFGEGIQIAGLLTARDIQAQLAGRDLGAAVLVPAVALRDGVGTFLDDVTPEALGEVLGVPVRVVEPTPSAFVAAAVAATGLAPS
jgi:putative radical SAM enzyme (TIGR03279 family)